MKLSDLYPSKYLKASDLQGKEPMAKIREVKIEEVGSDKERKPVLYFHGSDKAMILNKTNALAIGDHYGDDVATWAGKPIVLYSAWVDFGGKSTQAIRVRVPQALQTRGVPGVPSQAVVEMNAPPAHVAAPVGEPEQFGNLDDAIPF
jgi:hypothetical protein